MSVINAYNHQIPHFRRGPRENFLRAARMAQHRFLRSLMVNKRKTVIYSGLGLGLATVLTLMLSGIESTTPSDSSSPDALIIIKVPDAKNPAKSLPPSGWSDVARPIPMFSFEAPDFTKSAGQFTMRRHSTGGGREDSLTLGTITGSGSYLRIVIHQVGQEGAPVNSLFVETARRAADIGLAINGLTNTDTLVTRFGDMEWAEVRLSAAGAREAGAARGGCAAFRFASEKPGLRLFGLACGGDGEAINRKQMSCLIGRLDLVAAGEDLDLRDFFVKAERARDAACPGSKDRRSRLAVKPALVSAPLPALPPVRGGSAKNERPKSEH